MLFSETHDLVWQAAIAGGVTLTLGWMQHRTQLAVQAAAIKAQAAARGAATQVADVKTALQTVNNEALDKLDGIAEVGKKTHTLVNSAFGAQLRLHAETARALADARPSPEYREAAALADRLLREHQAKQKIVDQGGGNT